MTACRLCLSEGKLQDSHIYPEFLYKPLYDDGKHRYHVLDPNKDYIPYFLQKGIREKLLCEKCEVKFSSYEDYARRTFYGGHDPVIVPQFYETRIHPSGFHYIVVRGVDYLKFKLFVLSLFWRASLSTHRLFKNLKLESEEENFRLMLLNDEPRDKYEYGFLMVKVLDEEVGVLDGLILDADSKKIDDCSWHELFVAGTFFWLFIPDKCVPTYIRELYLDRSNELRIVLRRREDCPIFASVGKAVFGKKAT